MRARRIAAAAALFLSLLLLALPAARAQEESGLAGLLREETERLLGEMDLAPLQEAAPELDVASLLESASQGGAALPVGEILSAAGEALVGNLRSLAPRMVRLVGLAVLSAALLRLRADNGKKRARLRFDGVSHLRLHGDLSGAAGDGRVQWRRGHPPAEVLALCREVQRRVRERFGVELELEVRQLNDSEARR